MVTPSPENDKNSPSISFSITSNKNHIFQVSIEYHFTEIFFLAQFSEKNLQFMNKKTLDNFIQESSYYKEDFDSLNDIFEDIQEKHILNAFSLEEFENKIDLIYKLKGKKKFIIELLPYNHNLFLEEKLNFFNIQNLLTESNIIKNETEIKYLKLWINPFKNLEAKLLYRMSKDGKEFKNFHEKCDGEKNKNNLVLVETKNGFKIGGFTYDFWESNLKSKKGKESFIFSLNKKEKYPLLYGNYSIFCDIQQGPTFNKCDFAFTGNDMTKFISKGVCYYLYDKGSLLSNKNKEILNDYVDVKEVEVFQILFN